MKLSKSLQATGLATLIAPVVADWQYRSRPDLSPPRLNITIRSDTQPLEAGLLFIAPYPGAEPESKGPAQPAAYIYQDTGDLVWSGLGYFVGDIADFGVSVYKGEKVLRAFQGQRAETLGRAYGHHVLLNDKYEPVKTVRGHSTKLGSAHEFQLVDEHFAIVEIGSTKPVGLGAWGGAEGQDWIVSTGFQELDIETGEVVFDWESIDHVDPGDSALSLDLLPSSTGTDSSHAWDYFHINSVDKDTEGNYIVSGRHTKAIYKINGTSGDILWTLGGPGSTFDVEPAARFAFQHDARLLNRSVDGSIEVLSLFDNAAASDKQQISPFSRARILQLNHTDNTATALRTYPAPDGLSAHSQGNAQVLPSGNVLVNWGQAGAVTEFAEDGEVLFHAYLDGEPDGRAVQNYRGFRQTWTGRPSEEPALVVLEGDKVTAYVSWNGDTEVATWRFFVHDARGKKTLLGEAKRTGFETYLELDRSHIKGEFRVSAEGVDGKGGVLVSSSPVAISGDLPIHRQTPEPHGLLSEEL
ncbi:ASST-domain-containing protein [Plectosphaerella plurivora]|uniref:ASST-domain-containing protein n=1 Tax=Plectosphaerella plurivora TaxID=936078 RepID=A0A9P8VE52_9PEZI|nr:ASST-domain-containing protein [Plectosphaerella plurivora]